jgi:hypothetical protein
MDGRELRCARMDRPARTLSGSLMPGVLSHAYAWVPIMAPDTFSCSCPRRSPTISHHDRAERISLSFLPSA